MKNKLYQIRLFITLIIFIFIILGIIGIFYPINIFDIQLVPLLQKSIINFSIITIIILSVILIITLFFGRLYCSLICPMGIFQEILGLIFKKDNEYQKNKPYKYFISAITIGFMIGGSTLLIKYLDPYTLFTSAFTYSIIGLSAIIIIAIITFFKNRFFCTNICPVGTILGLISKISIFKLYIDKNECLSCSNCERNCPTGCINSDEEIIDNENCIKCLKCIGNCPKDAIKFGIKPKEEVKFNIKRRETIIAISACAIFLGAIKIGFEKLNNTISKFRDVILPPGSINEERLLDKCLNCNLCVNACPNKIIKKADNEFNAVHIDYNSGEKFCKFNCNECSKVCPSGAIKRISLEEKQKTRIAMATINEDKCINCNYCIFVCPVNAISKSERGKSIVDASKCIGCGACVKNCNVNAINIFAVKEQKVL